jgi:anti-anti-sigma regulatory factor
VQFKAEIEEVGKTRTIRIAGRLGRAEADELRRLCANPRHTLRLDLTDLLSADAAGLEMLATLRDRGAVLVGASPYITLRLQQTRQQVR